MNNMMPRVRERIRIISEQPLIANVLASWQPIIQHPLRVLAHKIMVDWIYDLETTLRAREFWTGLISTEIAATFYNAVKKPIVERIRNLFLKR